MLRRLKRLAWGHSPEIETLSERLDGRLMPEREREIDAHVASCDVCESVLSEMREARALLSAMSLVDVPRSFRLRVADVEKVPVRASSGGSSMMRWAPALSGAAVAVLVATIGIGQFSSGGVNSQLAGTQADAPIGSLASERGAWAQATTNALQMQPSPGAPAAGAVAPPDAAASTQPANETARTIVVTATGEPGDAAATAAESESDSPPTAFIAPDVASTDDDAAAEDGGQGEGGGTDGTESFAPPPAPVTTAPMGVAPGGSGEDQREAIEELESSDDDGNRDALFFVQIAAAIVAIAAAAGYVVWRFTRGGVTG